MADERQEDDERYSLAAGGTLNQMLGRAGLGSTRARILTFLGLTWLPLVVISAIEGTLLLGSELPLVKDPTPNVRFLIALPLLTAYAASPWYRWQ